MNKEKQNKIIQTLFGTKGKKNTQNYEEKPGGNQESLTGDFNCIKQVFYVKKKCQKGRRWRLRDSRPTFSEKPTFE